MNSNQQPTQAQMLGAMSKTTGTRCSQCEGFFFEPAILFRKLSRFVTGELQDQVIPIQAFRCMDCHAPLLEMFPEGMTDVEEALGLTKQPESKIKLT